MSEAIQPSPQEKQASPKIKGSKRASQLLQAWNKVAPFFVSAALFLSGFFAIFSPLPLLVLGLLGHPGWLLLSLASNAGLVYLASGPMLFQFYLLAIGGIGLFMPLLIRRGLPPEQIVGRTWLIQWCLVGLFVCVYALLKGVTPEEELSRMFAHFFDMMMASLNPSDREQLISHFGGGELGISEWRKQTLLELPGALGVICLIVAWFNLRVLLNINPNRVLHRVGLDRKALNRWRNPDFLVWPTLVAWAIVLLTEGVLSEMALNVFKVLMATYALQGLAVLGMLFDTWKIRGFMRMAVYFLVIFMMLPLLLSIGFFDQWFDFRAKFRQS